MCQDASLEPSLRVAAIRPLRWLLDTPGGGAKARGGEKRWGCLPGLPASQAWGSHQAHHRGSTFLPRGSCPRRCLHLAQMSLGTSQRGTKYLMGSILLFGSFLANSWQFFAEVSQPLVPPCAPATGHMLVCWLQYRPT